MPSIKIIQKLHHVPSVYHNKYAYVNGCFQQLSLSMDDVMDNLSEKALMRSGGDVFKYWVGTQNDYNNLTYKNSNTLYFIKE